MEMETEKQKYLRLLRDESHTLDILVNKKFEIQRLINSQRKVVEDLFNKTFK